ncbi:MAG TPA: hypothetical protein VGO33_09375 [Gemmatimonadaceae bacterium]|nr:hypothetical protein [Gemmatimonadaceae bacterium]
MSTNRNAAVALLTGSIAGLVTMAFHPTGHDVVRNASAGAANTLNVALHFLALAAQPLLLAGTLALTLRFRARRDMAVVAYIFFAVATVAVMIAAVASGFLAPSVVRGYAEADEPTRTLMINALTYTGRVNQAFATVYVAFSAVAILLWSVAALLGGELPRSLARYGIPLGAVLILGILSGYLGLDIHGFGLVVLGEGIWMAWAAGVLWRSNDD